MSGISASRRAILMEGRRARLQIYTVIEMWRGLAIDATSFTSLRRARSFATRVRGRQNEMEDDVAIFASSPRLPPRMRPGTRQHPVPRF